MNKYELFPGIYSNNGQTEALDLISSFLRSDQKVFLLNGAGGTGKTTIIKKILEDYPNKKWAGVTVSHKAKKVLGKSIGEDKVMTIASALSIKLNEQTGEFSPDVNKRKKGEIPINKLNLIIVDECSMLSDGIIAEFKLFKKPHAKIIFIGDISQLPPIGQERISSIFSLPNQYTLTEKMRQAATSPIIKIGELIGENQKLSKPLLRCLSIENRINQYDEESDSSVIFESDEDFVLTEFVKDFKKANGNVNYVKAVTFNNEKHNSSQSVKNLNQKIRKKIWGERSSEQFVIGEMLTSYDSLGNGKEIIFNNSEDFTVEGIEYCKNVRIEASAYCFKSAKSVFLDDIKPKKKEVSTVFQSLAGDNSEAGEPTFYDLVLLDLIDEQGLFYGRIPVVAESSRKQYEEDLAKLWKYSIPLAYALQNQFANLQYAYAITSTKSQGSTYINTYVFEDNILGSTNGGTVLAKNQALYVAVSRPRKKLVIVSEYNSSKPPVIKEKEDVFTISKTDSILAHIKQHGSDEPLNTITDSGFTTMSEIVAMLVYRSQVGIGKHSIEIHNITTGKSRGITKTIK
jgi:molybdopterin-guanine dinucleotide biosynthesis protein